jgi:hypothetical protein
MTPRIWRLNGWYGVGQIVGSGLATAMSESVQRSQDGTPPTRGDLDLMPRYFFDIEDGTTSMRDAEGSELADLRTAQREAAETLVDMGRDVFRTRDHGTLSATIRDDADTVLLTVSLTLSVAGQ